MIEPTTTCSSTAVPLLKVSQLLIFLKIYDGLTDSEMLGRFLLKIIDFSQLFVPQRFYRKDALQPTVLQRVRGQ